MADEAKCTVNVIPFVSLHVSLLKDVCTLD